MKTQFNQLTKTSAWILIVFLILNTLGCSNEPETPSSSVNTNTLSKKPVNKPSPPEIDMHTAVISGNIEAIKQHVLAKSDLNQKDPFGGSSPLMSAVLFGKTEIAKLLIEAGADINFINNEGATALHTSAFFCRPELTQILLDNGSDKTIKNKMGATAYETVSGEFKQVKPIYDMFGQSLAPFGLVLDYDYLQKTRPTIAKMLK